MFDNRSSTNAPRTSASRPKCTSCAQPQRRTAIFGELFGLESSYQIFADGQTALQKGYGVLFYEGGKVKITGPYGPLTIFDTETVYPSFHGPGYLYSQGGQLYVGGPAGPVAVKSPPAIAPTSSTAPVALPPPPGPTITQPSGGGSYFLPSPQAPVQNPPAGTLTVPVAPAGPDPAVQAALDAINAGGPGAPRLTDPSQAATPASGLMSWRLTLPIVGDVPALGVGAAALGTILVLALRGRRHG